MPTSPSDEPAVCSCQSVSPVRSVNPGHAAHVAPPETQRHDRVQRQLELRRVPRGPLLSVSESNKRHRLGPVKKRPPLNPPSQALQSARSVLQLETYAAQQSQQQIQPLSSV
ncbi:hypothetical protein F1559_005159 [Cyanidiococcus yangmingshanensis]|uniref:Uncharacterized protein n=1 Tax=Cyanidiococcus yangmingshanensis TaxID=2690220 RepID=A0A7J7IQZ1_9RHOD|nr:hypothetical protein F1559_005159 [Cyanidiococcus yangmingshanensis]